jgi:hypothetical protein
MGGWIANAIDRATAATGHPMNISDSYRSLLHPKQPISLAATRTATTTTPAINPEISLRLVSAIWFLLAVAMAILLIPTLTSQSLWAKIAAAIIAFLGSVSFANAILGYLTRAGAALLHKNRTATEIIWLLVIATAWTAMTVTIVLR